MRRCMEILHPNAPTALPRLGPEADRSVNHRHDPLPRVGNVDQRCLRLFQLESDLAKQCLTPQVVKGPESVLKAWHGHPALGGHIGIAQCGVSPPHQGASSRVEDLIPVMYLGSTGSPAGRGHGPNRTAGTQVTDEQASVPMLSPRRRWSLAVPATTTGRIVRSFAAWIALPLILVVGCGDAPNGPPVGTAVPTTVASETLDLASFTAALQDYWVRHAGEAGLTFSPLPAARIQPIDGQEVICDGQPVAAQDVADNAIALTCAEGPAVVWDPALIDDLTQKFGPTAPAMVLAHEWGHVLDAATNLGFEGVVAEQFADCIAGSFTAGAMAEGIAPYLSRAALDATVGATVDFSDPVGTDAEEEDAHGLGFDRIRALQEGYDLGAAKCVGYRTSAPPLTEVKFAKEDKKTNGNLPYDELLPLAMKEATSFAASSDIPFAAAAVGITSMSTKELKALHKRIGDGAPLTVLLLDSAATAQEAEGRDPSQDGERLQQACYAGAFLGWASRGESDELALSAGDVDESLATLTTLNASSVPGFVFELVSQMRAGFTQGNGACARR